MSGFDTTHWSVILRARGGAGEAREALEDLCPNLPHAGRFGTSLRALRVFAAPPQHARCAPIRRRLIDETLRMPPADYAAILPANLVLGVKIRSAALLARP